MNDAERLMFLGWAELPRFKSRIEQAKEFIRESFSISKNPYLSCSGGKDSIAMLVLTDQIARELGRSFLIWGHISDASFPGTREIIESAAQKCDRQLILDESEVSAFDVLMERDNVRQFGKSGYFFEAIKKFELNYQTDLAFVGVRASESQRRKKAAQVHGHLFRSNITTPRWVSNPIVWLSVEDVFALVLSTGFPLHPIYSKQHPQGVKAIRLGYLTAQDLLHKGTLSFLRINYPEQYDKVVAAKPSLSINT